jgi:hypothetical protein
MAEDVEVTFGAGIDGAISGISKITESIEGMSGPVHELGETFKALGEAVLAALAIEKIAEWAAEVAELGEKMQQSAQQTGIAASQLSVFNVAAENMGSSAEGVTSMMGRLERSVAAAGNASSAQAKAFNSFGISTAFVREHANDMHAIMMKLAEQFPKFADGSGKMAAAMALGGRGMGQWIPLLNKGTEGMKEVADQAQRTGTIVDTEMANRFAAADDKFDEFHQAVQGISYTLFDAFRPAISSCVAGITALIENFRQSITQGGLMKDMFVVLVAVVDACVQGVGFLSTSFNNFYQMVAIVVEGVAGYINTLGDVFKNLFAMHFEDAQKALDDGMKGISEKFHTRLNNMVDNSQDFVTMMKTQWKELQNLYWGMPKGDPVDNRPAVSYTPGSSKKDGNTNRLAEWRDEWQQRLTGEANYFADSRAAEIQFWESKSALIKQGLANGTLSQKQADAERMAIDRQIYSLRSALAHQDRDMTINAIQDELSASQQASQQTMSDIENDYNNKKISADKMFQLKREELQREWVLTQQYYQQQLALYRDEPVQRQRVNQQMQQAQRQFGVTMHALEQQQSNQRIQSWMNVGSTIESTFTGAIGTMLQGILQGTQTWQEAMANLFQNMAMAFINAVIQMIAQWLVFQAITGIMSIFGGGLPGLGSAGSSIIGHAGMAGFAVGAWEVPGDMIAQIHKGEMIVPADHAEAVRSGSTGVAPFPKEGTSGGGQQMSVALAVHTMDAASFKRFLSDNGRELAKQVSAQWANNPSLRPKFG